MTIPAARTIGRSWCALRKERAIGVFSRFREVPVGDAETAVVAGVFEEIDVPLRRTEGR